MSTDSKREALTALDKLRLWAHDPDTFSAIDADDAEEIVRILAGWMPRPEPGSPEWEAMVERGARAIYDAHWGKTLSRAPFDSYVNADVFRADARAALRAALGTGDASIGERR